MDHPLPSLRYVKAQDLQGQPFAGVDVEGSDGEKLGEVNGFIINANTRRPQYVVIDAGGWFKTKHALVPVGHISMTDGARALRADLTKDRVKRFPGVDLDEFVRWSGDQVARFDVDLAAVCCEGEQRPHDVTPDWWLDQYYIETDVVRGVRGADVREPAMAHERKTN
jgi:hypothetical protein